MDDVEAIKKLKARYFRLMDTKDWDAFRELVTPDVVVDVSSWRIASTRLTRLRTDIE